MKALKYQVTIGKDHQVTLTVPDAEGPAEVIVLVPEPSPGGRTLAAFLEDLPMRPRVTRSREELDREIDEARGSWD